VRRWRKEIFSQVGIDAIVPWRSQLRENSVLN
jgi:hypothetical protein